MALFSRKNPPDDTGNVRLSSADHSWWTGEAVPDVDAGTEAGNGGDGGTEAGNDGDGGTEAGNDGDGGADGDGGTDGDLSSLIAAALEEYGYGAAGEGLTGAGPTGPPASHDGPDADPHPHHGHDHGDSDAARVDVAALFTTDGLPADDRLGELLGTLGLGADADWVAVARAHRRLVAPPTGGRLEHDNECQRRAANQAYAYLRLFHH